jgi:hypothetical protein
MALFGRPTPEDDARADAWRDWLRRRDPLAVASFVLGVFSLTHFGTLWVDGLAAVVLGVVALVRLSAGPEAEKPHGHLLAIGGIAAAVLSLVLAAVFVYRWV